LYKSCSNVNIFLKFLKTVSLTVLHKIIQEKYGVGIKYLSIKKDTVAEARWIMSLNRIDHDRSLKIALPNKPK